jgi:hypothetical protein
LCWLFKKIGSQMYTVFMLPTVAGIISVRYHAQPVVEMGVL